MLHELLKDKKLILASVSPRRKEIFHLLGLDPQIINSNVIELPDDCPPKILVQKHAMLKAECVSRRFNDDAVIVSADTLVSIERRTLGKPKDSFEAMQFLTLLSGKKHFVFTGICIIWKNIIVSSYEKSMVEFKQLSAKEINTYIDTKEPLDKAGAYGIQGFGCQFILGIKGCYFNVMGFPVHLFYSEIEKLLSNNPQGI